MANERTPLIASPPALGRLGGNDAPTAAASEEPAESRCTKARRADRFFEEDEQIAGCNVFGSVCVSFLPQGSAQAAQEESGRDSSSPLKERVHHAALRAALRAEDLQRELTYAFCPQPPDLQDDSGLRRRASLGRADEEVSLGCTLSNRSEIADSSTTRQP